MKAVIAALVMFVTAASFSHGAPENTSQQRVGKVSKLASKRSMSYGRYSSIVNSLISHVSKLDITAEQRTKLNAMRQDYVFPMAKDESESSLIRSDAMKKLSDPGFDASAAKKELDKAESLDKKSAEKFVDALVSLRSVIGKENYAKISDSRFGNEQNLVQMRQRSVQFQRNVELDDLKENAPVPAESPGNPETDKAAPKE